MEERQDPTEPVEAGDAVSPKTSPAPITEAELASWERIDKEALPAPWRWNVNPRARLVRIENIGSGFEFVMCFERWGMGGAAPRFRNSAGHLERVERFLAAVPGREHHAHWFQDINHPDARAMVVARNALPRLLAEIRALREENERLRGAIRPLLHHIESLPPEALGRDEVDGHFYRDEAIAKLSEALKREAQP